jgi:hypothetical protein
MIITNGSLPRNKEPCMVKKFLLLALVLAVASPVWADSPSGTINFAINSSIEWDPWASVPAAELGINGIQGVFNFQGKHHTIRMQGLKTSIPGVRTFSAIGNVYNLREATDLAGTYHKATPTGIAFTPGETGLVVQNDKGVVINFKVITKRLVGVMRTIGEQLKREGVPLDLMPGGLTIQLVQ